MFLVYVCKKIHELFDLRQKHENQLLCQKLAGSTRYPIFNSFSALQFGALSTLGQSNFNHTISLKQTAKLI